MNKKKITIIVILVSIILTVIAITTSTYALFYNEKVAPNKNEYSTGLLSIEASSKTETISLNNAIPMEDSEGVETKPYIFTISNKGNLDYTFNVRLLSTSSNTINPNYIKLKIDDGEVTTLSSLTNSTIKSNLTLKAKESIDIEIRVWLAINTPNTEIGKTFTSNLVIDGQAVYTEPSRDDEIFYSPNPPALDNGLIPVTISNDGTVISVTQDDNNWYNYRNKKWANAVLVKETGVKTRTQNKVAGTTINPNDILAYFVWIPRYSYKVWSLTAEAKNGQEQEIEIKFVPSTEKQSATKVNDWHTHPAFSFGGAELSGIWVGKFETSMDENSTCYSTRNAANCNNNNVDPRIVPNDYSLRSQNISNQFQTALKFAGGTMTNDIVSFAGSNKYGLTQISDSHPAKNTEWGAVAYLSHSKYGIGNVNVRINNRSTNQKLTGCGALTAGGASTNSCEIAYGSNVASYPQSTTGNISGIFDMSGGAWEYTMANLGKNTGKSGLSSEWFTINSKYIDIYDATIFNDSMTNNLNNCTFAVCGGQAIGETRGWHGNSIASFYTLEANTSTGYTGYWGTRGGGYSNNTSCGIFKVIVDRSVDTNGTESGGISFRTILVIY